MASDFEPPVENALTSNSIGLPSDLTGGKEIQGSKRFPAWVSRSEADGITKLQLGAIRLEHFADLVFTQPDVFVFSVGHVSGLQGDDGTWQPISLATIAADVGAQPKEGDDENVLLASDGFRHLVTQFGHFQLSALGLPKPVDDLVDLWVRAQDQANNEDGWVLDAIDEADAFVAIHDNCYATVELRSPEVADELVARMLWIALSTAARPSGLDVPNEPPPKAIVAECLGESGLFFTPMQLTEAPAGSVDLPFSHSNFAIDEQPATKLLRHAAEGWSVHPLEEA